MRKHVKNQSGDTLIEVLIAVAILSLATVMTMSVVNNSHREILAEINRETVRSEINSQAELIQYYHNISEKLGAGSANVWADSQKPEEVELWDAIKSLAIDNPDDAATAVQADTCGRGTNPFYLARGDVTPGTVGKTVVSKDDSNNNGSFTNNANSNTYYVVTAPDTVSLRGTGNWSARPGSGIWINAIHRYTPGTDGKQIANDPNDYYDFYIKACWLSTNSSEDRNNLLVRVNNGSVSQNGSLTGSTEGYGGTASAGFSYTCVINNVDGSVWCWGRNEASQLGLGRYGGYARVPEKVVNGTQGFVNSAIRSVATGVHHTCAIDSGFNLWCWGYNAEGQIGVGFTCKGDTGHGCYMASPRKVVGLEGKKVKSVAIGYLHTCVIAGSNAWDDADDWVYCWGNGDAGELGNSKIANYQKDVQTASRGDVPSGHVFKTIVAGEDHTCGIAGLPGNSSQDYAYCWGYNNYGKLGIGGSAGTVKSTPNAVKRTGGVLDGKTIKFISIMHTNTCVIASDNRAYCMGDNGEGKLGAGESAAYKAEPVAVKGVLENKDVSAIATGYYNTCAISDGRAYCWGANGSGQIGDGTVGHPTGTSHRLPTAVAVNPPSGDSQLSSGARLVSIAAYELHVCASDTVKRLYCWGTGDEGELGVLQGNGTSYAYSKWPLNITSLYAQNSDVTNGNSGGT